MKKIVLYFIIPLACLVFGHCDGAKRGYEQGVKDESERPKRCTVIELQNCPCEMEWKSEKLPKDE